MASGRGKGVDCIGAINNVKMKFVRLGGGNPLKNPSPGLVGGVEDRALF